MKDSTLSLPQQFREIVYLGQLALTTDNIPQLLAEATQITAQALNVEFSGIWTLVTDDDALLLQAGIGWPEEKVGDTLIKVNDQHFLWNNPFVVINETPQSYHTKWPLLQQHHIKNGISVRIKGKARPFGILGVFTPQHRIFDDPEIHFLQSVANILSMALELKEAKREITQRNSELLAFQSASAAVTSSLDLEDVLYTVAQAVIKLLNVPGCAISTWDKTDDTLVLLIDYGPDEWTDKLPPNTVYHLKDYPLTKQVLVQRLPQQITTIQPDADEAELAEMHRMEIETLLMIPMIFQDQVIGLLEIFDDWAQRVFTDQEIMLAQLQANQAAGAIENARLYIKVKQQASQLEQRILERTLELTNANQELQAGIAHRKRIEKDLVKARDQALEASKLKTELLAKVSHELRTPLGSILGYAELLEFGTYGPVSDEQREILANMIDSTQYQITLVNELLDQAQLEAGRLKLNIRSFSATDIVESVYSKMKILAQEKGLNLRTEISSDLPEKLRGDPERIQQVLLNLVGNALKFTEQGTVQIKLYSLNDDYWAIKVSDTGPGIPPEAQTHVFKPFRQVDGSITRKHGGTGLGLSIVKQLVSLMDGEIILQSEIGQGSTFMVQLPFHPPQRL